MTFEAWNLVFCYQKSIQMSTNMLQVVNRIKIANKNQILSNTTMSYFDLTCFYILSL